MKTTASPQCKQAGLLAPMIDRNRCEAKSDCVLVCPYDVFEIAILSPEQRQALSWVGKVKGAFSRYEQAFVIDPERCHSCGLCVTACPEKAIKLARLAKDDS